MYNLENVSYLFTQNPPFRFKYILKDKPMFLNFDLS